MPWDKRTVKKFRKDMTGSEAVKFAKTANGVLSDCLSKGGLQKTCESKAIATAQSQLNKSRNKKESRMDPYYIARLSEILNHQVEVVSVNRNEGTIDIQVIKPGRSLNPTVYYDSNMGEIERILNSAAEGHRWVRMFIDHDHVKEGEEPAPRSVRDWGATILKAWIPDSDPKKGVQATVKVFAFNKWLLEAAESDALFLGVSIDGYAIVEEVEDAGDGLPGIKVLQMTALRSVDWVVEAAAGGGILLEEVTDKPTREGLLNTAVSLAKGNTQLSSIVESLKSSSYQVKAGTGRKISTYVETKNTKESTTNLIPENGKSVKEEDEDTPKRFAIELAEKEAKEAAWELLWKLNTYIREVAFSKELTLETKLDYTKEAVETVIKSISELFSTINGTEDEEQVASELIKIEKRVEEFVNTLISKETDLIFEDVLNAQKLVKENLISQDFNELENDVKEARELVKKNLK